jgi:hypothetical protein
MRAARMPLVLSTAAAGSRSGSQKTACSAAHFRECFLVFKMFRLVTIASLTATVSAQWGYTTDTDTTGAEAIGTQLLAVRAAIEGSSVEGDETADGLCTFTSSTDFGVTEGTCVSTGSEATATCKYVAGTANAGADGWETDDSCVAISWATAITAYQLDVGGGDTLANIGKKYGDTSAEYRKFKAYHEENEDYAHDFVYAALADTVQTRLPLSAPGGTPMVQLPEVAAAEPDQRGGPIGIAIKSRQELTTKGLALQTLMMVRHVPRTTRRHRIGPKTSLAVARAAIRLRRPQLAPSS